MAKRLISMVITMVMILSLVSVVQVKAAGINIGDYVLMGKYYDEPILWRCVDIDENGPLMLSDKIISIKPYDAHGSNITNNSSHGRAVNNGEYRKQWGSNYWADSNMRSWLNSTASAGNVNWLCGNPPSNDKVWYGYNDYATEKGFLADGNFTASECNAIKTVMQKSLLGGTEYSSIRNSNYHMHNSGISSVVQNYDTAYSEQVTDKMFLLDVKQVNKVYQNLGSYYMGQITQKAVDNSDFALIDGYYGHNASWSYSLRSPEAISYDGVSVRFVDWDGSITAAGVDCAVGIRPAFYINLSSAIFKSGTGTVDMPYVVTGGSTTEPPTPIMVNKPQTLTPFATNVTIKADSTVEKDGIITYSGNVAINEYLKLNGKLEKDTKNFTLKGEGQLYLETSSPHFHGVINIYKGKFDFNADGAEILKGLGADTLKIANLEFSIIKMQLINGGMRLGGNLKLPKNIGGGGVTIDNLEIVNGKIKFPSGQIMLPKFKLGKSAIGLSDAYLVYDADANYFEGAGTLNIPKLFAINSTIGIENAKLEKVGIGISGLNVAIDASGVFLNSIYGEIEGLASPPIVVTATTDISGGPKVYGVSVLKGEDLTIKVDMSGILSGSGELKLVNIPLANANFKIEANKGFEAGASFNAFDIITGNCNLKIYYNPVLTLQGESVNSLNIPNIGTISETKGYFDNEKIVSSIQLTFVKGVLWVKYNGEWGFDFNADLQQMTNYFFMAEDATNYSLMAEDAFVIPTGTDKAMVKITYTGGSGDVVLIAPDGTRITPENSEIDSMVSNYIKLDNQKTIYYLLNNPQAGQWQHETVNSTFTDLKVQTGKINDDPTLRFTSAESGDIAVNVSSAIGSINVPMQWQCNQTNGTVDILYSTKENDNLGIPLATGIDVNSGSYTWGIDSKVPSGKYYITAVYRSSGAVPVFAYYNRAVVVNNATTPSTPASVATTCANGNITVSWQANAATDIKGYNIYVNDGIDEKVYNIGLYDSYEIVGLGVAKNYRVQVTTVNNDNLESAKSGVSNVLLSTPVPPSLTVDWSANQYTNNGLMPVKGTAEAGATVKVFVNDILAVENLTGSFDTSVTLEEGKNEIKIVAKNGNGDSIEKINTYWYDSSNPQLSVNNIFDGMNISTAYYVVSGSVEPNANFLINGKKVSETDGKFVYALSLIPGSNNVTISATDIAGNKTEFVGTVTFNGQGISAQPVVYLDSNNVEITKLSELTEKIINTKSNVYNNTNGDINIWFITAKYKDGKLVGLVKSAYTVQACKTLPVQNTVDLPIDLTGYSIKSVIWTENLRPIVVTNELK